MSAAQVNFWSQTPASWAGDRFTEAVHINKSLFALQGVVAALADGAPGAVYLRKFAAPPILYVFFRFRKTCAFADDLNILKDLAEIPISAGSIAIFCA